MKSDNTIYPTLVSCYFCGPFYRLVMTSIDCLNCSSRPQFGWADIHFSCIYSVELETRSKKSLEIRRFVVLSGSDRLITMFSATLDRSRFSV